MDSATRAAREESKLQILRQSVVARVSLLSLAHPDHAQKRNLMMYVYRERERHTPHNPFPICSLTLTAPLCITSYAQFKAYTRIPLLAPPTMRLLIMHIDALPSRHPQEGRPRAAGTGPTVHFSPCGGLWRQGLLRDVL